MSKQISQTTNQLLREFEKILGTASEAAKAGKAEADLIVKKRMSDGRAEAKDSRGVVLEDVRS